MESSGFAPVRVTVVVPTYNEADNIEQLWRGVAAHGYELLVVDDGSPDGTGAIVDRLAIESRSVSVIHRASKGGLGTAYAVGFSAAIASGADVVCQMDADLSHDPAQLPRLVDAVVRGAEVAVGSRFIPGGEILDWPLRRRLLSRMGNIYARVMLSLRIRDATSGFRAFRPGVLARLEPGTCAAQGYAFQVEMAWRATLAAMKLVEVPITFRERARGDSKLDASIVREAMWLVTKWGIGRWTGRASWRPTRP